MSKHTPGPWKVDKELTAHAGEWLIHIDCGNRNRGNPIAETRPATGRELANARLIAAAPELLEALQELSDEISRNSYAPWCEHIGPWILKARAAITKATGEDQ